MEIPGYQIGDLIDQGGMASVYRAEQLSLKREVAVKFLSENLLHHPLARELFANEPLIVAQLNHPKIIHIIDKGITADGKPYFIMEYVKGTTLHDLVQDKPLSTSEKIQYIIQICKGLAYAHRNGIVHRDIKPANIIIDEENNARILDFGIASFCQDNLGIDESKQVLGTAGYMAPEVKTNSAAASILSDIYSLGILMYEVFSEDFSQEFDVATLHQHPKLNKTIGKIVSSCVQTQSDLRPSSASVIEQIFLQLLKGAHLAISQKAEAERDLSSLSKNFLLLDVIKETSYSSVYLYEKQKNHHLIVIKKRNQDNSGLKEAKLLSNLKHPNIIHIHGTASNQRSFIIVMEHMDGGSLSDRLLTPFAPENFFPIARKICLALQFAHQNRIIHGNLRPSNLLFDQTGEVKVTDFGQSEHYQDTIEAENWYRPQKTEAPSPALDVFSLGAIFYHMLCGEHLTWKNTHVSWKESYSELPQVLQQLLLKMLALDPAYRYQQMAEVISELDKLSASPKSQLKPKAKSLTKRVPTAKRSLGYWLKQGFFILLVAVVVTYLQIHWFFPELKQLLLQTLSEWLQLLATELNEAST
ncbi:protein kinase [Pleionea sp. CnH1-48]|uniref:protein kinase domain-containing protein n=1 Tax=Pleionea sp. CnH1-48 TaxID=2954494 RepID=UPI002098498C|nr:protein kinase [Pleionea sp. CnH1-48]MCO7226784.1 protein kinase [Pleionea sp. CnH1-48]